VFFSGGGGLLLLMQPASTLAAMTTLNIDIALNFAFIEHSCWAAEADERFHPEFIFGIYFAGTGKR
jgi:hypothetical protein